jgi:dethiobiotin synthetase
MGAGLFITGTDTGVGKTLVACALAALLRERGYTVGVLKPVETGCPQRDGQLFPADAFNLQKFSGCEEAPATICPYAFEEALAPALAAARSGVAVDIDVIEAVYGKISAAHDVTLVEGAGGLFVPLLPHYTYADLAHLLKIPLLVVAANRLGALNHLLLTLEHASCRGLSILGYILNRVESEASLAAETNSAALTTLTSVPCLGEIPYLPRQREVASFAERPAALADLIEGRLDLAPLETALRRR